MFPQIMKTLDAIHHVDVSDTQGYGVFNYQGKGMTTSWHKFLRKVVDYAERILCYQCYCALDGMRFFAKSSQEDSYQTVCTRMLQKLK